MSFFVRSCIRRISVQTSKGIHFSCVHRDLMKSKTLQKMINKGGKRKKTIHYSMNIPNVFGPAKKKINPVRQKRLEQISKVFYHYISDLIEFDHENINENVEISKVKIDNDFTAVTVYWVATGTEKDDIIQDMLTKKSYSIRQRLIDYHLVGTVPPIVFVPDTSSVNYEKILKLLKEADMGTDFKSTSDCDFLKSEPKVILKDTQKPLQNQIDDNDLEVKYDSNTATTEKTPVSDSSEDSDEISSSITTQFTYQVYDLNYTRLINKVKGQTEPSKFAFVENDIKKAKIPDEKFLKDLLRQKNTSDKKHSEYTVDQYMREHSEENETD
ncbi:uncharacterized protein LOC115214927 [Octopus sinensis]|uniref:Uncharacterized protein LOC115214927 n=1 Tax=Octopus sinensis TaxID=2607531 RepID=A0A6P7SNJ3_9MOLL|nr:uncharacterized protein LOC115214927 [Octopus sinensis]XP_036361206.1 uncharacterized protein LOC115214927 [Octopus sinensis]